MDDATINRLVARHIYGQHVQHDDDRGWHSTRTYTEPFSNVVETWFTPIGDYCNDPAAWGALLVWLARLEGDCDVEISSDYNPDKGGAMWLAIVYHARVAYRAAAWEQPGRALALAALKAHGVEVPS